LQYFTHLVKYNAQLFSAKTLLVAHQKLITLSEEPFKHEAMLEKFASYTKTKKSSRQ